MVILLPSHFFMKVLICLPLPCCFCSLAVVVQYGLDLVKSKCFSLPGRDVLLAASSTSEKCQVKEGVIKQASGEVLCSIRVNKELCYLSLLQALAIAHSRQLDSPC